MKIKLLDVILTSAIITSTNISHANENLEIFKLANNSDYTVTTTYNPRKSCIQQIDIYEYLKDPIHTSYVDYNCDKKLDFIQINNKKYHNNKRNKKQYSQAEEIYEAFTSITRNLSLNRDLKIIYETSKK